MTKTSRDLTVGRWFMEGPRGIGALIFVAHTILALLIFIVVHFSSHYAQSGIQWVILMGIDAPITFTVFEYIATSVPMEALAEWGNGWGDGTSLKALVIYGALGGAQWFSLGWLIGTLFWPKTGWIAKWFGKPT